MARVQQLAFTKQVPLKFRVGGGACLSLLGSDAEDEKPRVWQVTGVPANWTAQDVVRCLEGAGCEDTTVVRRPTKAQPWMILSRVQKEFQNVQVFGVETNGIYLTLSKPPPKKSITGKKAVAAGFWQHRELPQVACPDVATTRTEVTNAADTAVVARKKHKPETPLPYEVIDCGGAGNCGWNCIATAMMLNKNVTLEEAREQVAAATKTLRADVSTHLHRHAKEYEPLWAANDQETEDTAGGSIPENFPEWAETVKRDGQWLCGMTLEAITRRCGIRIVVVEERADGSAVPYVFGPNKKREFPVVLYLKDQHFQLVRKRDGHVFPVEWEKSNNTNDASRLHLKGAGKWWADSTPSKKGSERKKVNRSSTPAASLSSAAGSQLRFWSRGSPSEAAPVSTHGSPRVRYWKKTTPDKSFVSGRVSLADKHAQEHEDSGSARSVTALPPRPSEVGGQVSDALIGPGPTPGGRIGTIHELTKEEQMSRPWWTCQLCGFHVFQKWIQGKYCNSHYTHRKRHLLKAHGVKKPPPLPKFGLHVNAVRTAARVKLNRDVFWKAIWEAYNRERWPGSHRIAFEGSRTISKGGFGVWNHRCLDCNYVMPRGNIPKSGPCPKSSNASQFPAQAERIRQWRKLQQLKKVVAKQQRKLRYKGAMTNGKENAAHANRCRWEQKRQKLVLSQEPKGTAQTKRGYRGQRVGEARHPGPLGLVDVLLFCFMAQDRVSGRRYEMQFLASGRLSDLLWGLSGMGTWNVEPAPGQQSVTVFSRLGGANQIFGKKNGGFPLRNKTCLSKFAGGTALIRRGYRGQRIGEASHPGPQAPSCAPDERLGLGYG